MSKTRHAQRKDRAGVTYGQVSSTATTGFAGKATWGLHRQVRTRASSVHTGGSPARLWSIARGASARLRQLQLPGYRLLANRAPFRCNRVPCSGCERCPPLLSSRQQPPGSVGDSPRLRDQEPVRAAGRASHATPTGGSVDYSSCPWTSQGSHAAVWPRQRDYPVCVAEAEASQAAAGVGRQAETYANSAAGSKLMVALGHTRCGAIKGACDNVQRGHSRGHAYLGSFSGMSATT